MTADLAVGFLAAICEEPDDVGPRLVYADWLEEQGCPEAHDRACFIRLQCLLATLPAGDSRVSLIEEQEQRYLARHGGTWAAPLRGLVQYHAFHRGFAEEVGVTTTAFVAHAERISEATPLHTLHLWDHADLAALAGCPWLRRVRHLDLSGSPVSDVALAEVFAADHLTRLTGLNLSNCQLGPRGLEALCSGNALPALRELYLGNNGLDDAGALALAGTAGLGAVRTLELLDTPLRGETLAALRARFGRGLLVG